MKKNIQIMMFNERTQRISQRMSPLIGRHQTNLEIPLLGKSVQFVSYHTFYSTQKSYSITNVQYSFHPIIIAIQYDFSLAKVTKKTHIIKFSI